MSIEIIVVLFVVLIILFGVGLTVLSYKYKQKQLPANTSKLSQTRTQLLTEAIGIRSASVLYDPDLHPDKAEWGLRRAYLAILGVKQEDIELILGSHNDFYSRGESAINMATYIEGLPKG